MPKRAKSKRPSFKNNDNNYKNDHIQTGIFFREYLIITSKPPGRGLRVANSMAVLSNWESFSVIKMAPYPSVFLMNINWHFLNFWEKNGQYQTGYTGNIKTGIFFIFCIKRAFSKRAFFLIFWKNRHFQNGHFMKKMKNGHIPNDHFLKISYRNGHFSDFQTGKKKTYEALLESLVQNVQD